MGHTGYFGYMKPGYLEGKTDTSGNPIEANRWYNNVPLEDGNWGMERCSDAEHLFVEISSRGATLQADSRYRLQHRIQRISAVEFLAYKGLFNVPDTRVWHSGSGDDCTMYVD